MSRLTTSTKTGLADTLSRAILKTSSLKATAIYSLSFLSILNFFPPITYFIIIQIKNTRNDLLFRIPPGITPALDHKKPRFPGEFSLEKQIRDIFDFFRVALQ